MPRFRLGFSAVFHGPEAVLHVLSERGVRRFFAAPLRAQQLDLGRCPPDWQDYQPTVRLDRLMRIVAEANLRRRELDPWARPGPILRAERRSAAECRALETAAAVNSFIRAVGEGLWTAAARFRSCGRQFTLLRYLQQVPLLLRLRANPALLFAALANAATGADENDALALLSEAASTPPCALARRLGFPNDRFLRRVSPEDLDEERVEKLRALSRQSQARRTLSHLKRITGDVIELMSDPDAAPCLDNRFIEELGRDGAAGNLPTANEVAGLLRFLGQCSDRPVRLQGVQQFWRLCESHPALELVGLGDLESLLQVRLPGPPVPEEPGYARALKTIRLLITESAQMHNCVAGQYEKVLDGRAYYYRIEGGWGMPRGTMEIVPRDGIWRISQIVGPHNTHYPARYARSAAIWLADRQGILNEEACLAALHDDG